MTVREWNTRWREKLASVAPGDIVHVHSDFGTFHSFYGMDGEYVSVSRFPRASKRERERVHRKNVTRISCLLKGVMHG